MSKLLQRLTDSERSGVYRAEAARAIEEALQGIEADLARVSLRAAHTKDEVLDRLAAALGFPAWFGRNWDAAEDCLADLSWRPSAPVQVLLFEDAQPSAEIDMLCDVLAAAADFWRSKGRPFFAVFVDPKGALPLPLLHRPG
ncbi:MAG TPA: barstar family protein [Burkholderiales bacterium]|nr:barstar family protein [Burkholderiales bacterium]